ncbi:hypothetical protein CIG75_14860 [Tumebacillus algifaecis]|uniref:Uncharacterized protein n=1 Tax=Tumebacillus algifaecis TaxID=1214604 RepID=A0A223D3G4_9BACL|nr:hypothetical protein [Tumebacillus algifaecis]ASS76111.1 hypothetical protein CIG75_14860 [Tumebacillus algifaecis]
MTKKFKTFWSIALSFLMVFLLATQPIHASANNVPSAVQETEIVPIVESGTGVNPEGVIEPDVLPLLLAPVAASAFTSTVINSIFAVALGWYVGSSAQSLFQGAVNDKHSASTSQYTLTSTTEYSSTFPEYIGATHVKDSAAKHIAKEVVQELHNRIKNYSNENNYRAFSSSVFPGNTMYVIDINSTLNSTVNRHLGNNIAGLSGFLTEDPNYRNETLDLAGYSIFIISSKNDQKVFHAHFTPQYLKNREIEYNRYKGQFDIQTYPVRSQNMKYLMSTGGYTSNFNAARDNRGLLQDTKGNISVVPYK